MNPCSSSFHRQLTDEHRRRSLEEESVWLRLRSLTLRLLASLATLGHTPPQQNSEVTNENGVGDKTSILSSLLSQLNQNLQTAAQIAEKGIQVCFTQAVETLTPAYIGLISKYTIPRDYSKDKSITHLWGFVQILDQDRKGCQIL